METGKFNNALLTMCILQLQLLPDFISNVSSLLFFQYPPLIGQVCLLRGWEGTPACLIITPTASSCVASSALGFAFSLVPNSLPCLPKEVQWNCSRTVCQATKDAANFPDGWINPSLPWLHEQGNNLSQKQLVWVEIKNPYVAEKEEINSIEYRYNFPP